MRSCGGLILGWLAAGATVATAGGSGGKVPWVKKYDQALAQAKASGKPLMVYFTMDG